MRESSNWWGVWHYCACRYPTSLLGVALRKYLAAVIAAAVIVAAVLVAAAAGSAPARAAAAQPAVISQLVHATLPGTDPPECKNTTITSGATVYYAKFCGWGPDGERPLKTWVTGLVDDGGGLTLACGATTADRCVFLAPGSPAS